MVPCAKTLRRAVGSVLGLTAMALLPMAAHADSYSVFFNFGPELTNWSTTATLDKFNSGLGELTGVTIELTGITDLDYYIDNDNSQQSTFTPKGDATIKLSGITGYSGGILQVIPLATTDVILEADNGDGVVPAPPDYNPPDGTTGTVSDTKTTAGNIDAGSLSFYNGPGTFNLALGANGTASIAGPGNFQSAFKQTASAQVKVTYNFNLPEPGTLALAIPGLLGVAAVVRRRKAA